MTLSEMTGEYIRDGMTIYLAGFSHLIPFAAGHELIRQHRQHLTLCRATPDLLYDQMIAAGVADRVVFSYAGNPGVGLLPAFRRAVETGQIAIDEYTHFEMVARLEAGAAGLPFWPLRSPVTDLAPHNVRRTVICPYTGQEIPTVPALVPDVTLVHVQAADEEGNLYVEGLVGEMREAALAARTVLATAEQIYPARSLRQRRSSLLLPGFRVTAAAVVPFGAHPSYAAGLYERDSAFYQAWTAIAGDANRCQSWLEEWIYGTENHQAYLTKLGHPQLEMLRMGEHHE
ncbi:MAG: CoA transferase subunit A [Firmicutes bacterium]|nr:CoA transferase subunit A [Bacillota bacterium]